MDPDAPPVPQNTPKFWGVSTPPQCAFPRSHVPKTWWNTDFNKPPQAKIQRLELSSCCGKLPKGSRNNWAVTSRHKLDYTLAV